MERSCDETCVRKTVDVDGEMRDPLTMAASRNA